MVLDPTTIIDFLYTNRDLCDNKAIRLAAPGCKGKKTSIDVSVLIPSSELLLTLIKWRFSIYVIHITFHPESTSDRQCQCGTKALRVTNSKLNPLVTPSESPSLIHPYLHSFRVKGHRHRDWKIHNLQNANSIYMLVKVSLS